MSFSEAHPRDARGRFATGGPISGRDSAVYADGVKLGDVRGLRVTLRSVGTVSENASYPLLPRRPSWRHPVLVWRWWRDRRRGVAWRDSQQTRSGTFKAMRMDDLWARRMYQFLGLEPPPLASWPVRAIARALTWGIVARMVRGG